MLRRKVFESIVWTSLEWTFKPTKPNTKFARPNHAVYTRTTLSFLGRLCLWFPFTYSVGHKSTKMTNNK